MECFIIGLVVLVLLMNLWDRIFDPDSLPPPGEIDSQERKEWEQRRRKKTP